METKRKQEKNKNKLIFSLEDEEAIEDWPLPAIVPTVFSRYKGKTEVECYFGVYDIVRTFLFEHDRNPFSKKALEDLDRRLAPYLESQGYERGSGVYRFYKSFVLWDKRNLRTDSLCETSQMLCTDVLEKIKINKTDFDLRELLKKELPAALTVKDGKLLSVATVNEHSENQRLLEATVYTLPEARGKGYAKSNVALLCKHLLENKKGIVYCCSCHNRASIAVAKAVGFRAESRFYAVDAYRKKS